MDLNRVIFLLILLFASLPSMAQNSFYICLSNADLLRLNPGYCKPVLIGNMKIGMYDVALSPSGILYGTSNNMLYTIDTTTAEIQEIGPTPVLNALVCDKKGRLFGAYKNLYQIDTATGKYIDLGKITHVSAGDLTFYNDTMYMAAQGNRLVRVNYTPGKVKSASTTFIGDMNTQFPVFGVITVNKVVNNRLTTLMYACSGRNMFEVNRFNAKLSSQCNNMLINGEIYGAASVAEFFPQLNLPRVVSGCMAPYTLSVDAGWDKYEWNTGDTGRSIKVTKTGKFWVKATYGTYTLTDTVNVEIGIQRELSAGKDTVVCRGETVTLTATGVNISQFAWNTGATTASVTVMPDSTTKYYVLGKNPGCPDIADTIVVIVKDEMKINAGKDITICEGGAASLKANGENFKQLVWNTGDTTTEVIVKPAETTTYFVKAKSFLCPDVTDSVTVHVVKKPEIKAEKDVICCQGDAVTLKAGANNYNKIIWNTGDTTLQINVSPKVNTKYYVTAKNDNCPSVTDSVTVQVHHRPKADFGLDPASGIYPLTVRLQNSSKDEEKICWIMDGPNNLATENEVNITVNKPGVFGVALVAYNKGCTDTVRKYINVKDTFLIHIPDVFSPNDDSLNELWFPVATGYKLMNVKIFNRWGEEVYHLVMPEQKGWDGTCNGRPVPEGQYLYMIEILDTENNKIYKSGKLTLIR